MTGANKPWCPMAIAFGMISALPFFDAKDAWITPSLVAVVLALLFTVGSFWWIQVRRGRLRGYTSHAYSGAFGPDKLVLVVPIVFHNPAPAPLVVTDLRLRIDGTTRIGTRNDSGVLPIRLRWIASHAAVYPQDETRTYAAAFAVDGRKAIDKFIEFQYDKPPTHLEDGPYCATVEALVEPRRWWAKSRWMAIIEYTFNTQLAIEARASLIPRSNDPDLWGLRDQVWS
jgi:hypothetical protein